MTKKSTIRFYPAIRFELTEAGNQKYLDHLKKSITLTEGELTSANGFLHAISWIFCPVKQTFSGWAENCRDGLNYVVTFEQGIDFTIIEMSHVDLAEYRKRFK